jgi:hypothetical protein
MKDLFLDKFPSSRLFLDSVLMKRDDGTARNGNNSAQPFPGALNLMRRAVHIKTCVWGEKVIQWQQAAVQQVKEIVGHRIIRIRNEEDCTSCFTNLWSSKSILQELVAETQCLKRIKNPHHTTVNLLYHTLLSLPSLSRTVPYRWLPSMKSTNTSSLPFLTFKKTVRNGKIRCGIIYPSMIASSKSLDAS